MFSGWMGCSIVDATVCLVALQISLVDLLGTVGFSQGVCERYIGHSAGEIVAGHFDGCYSLEATLDIAFFRGTSAAQVAKLQSGAMCVVDELSRENIEIVIEGCRLPLDIACHTGHQQVTQSGADSDLKIIEAELQKVCARVIRLQNESTPLMLRFTPG